MASRELAFKPLDKQLPRRKGAPSGLRCESAPAFFGLGLGAASVFSSQRCGILDAMKSLLCRATPALLLSSMLVASAVGGPMSVGPAQAAYQDEDDNEPPKVQIVSPKNGAEVAIGKALFVMVKATDNTIIKKVHMHINGSEVGSIDGSADENYRFEVRDIQQGEYTFKAVAVDLAGNEASSEEIKVTGVEKKEEDEPKEKEKEKPKGEKSDEDASKKKDSKEKSEEDESKKSGKSEEGESKKKSEEDESKKKEKSKEGDSKKKSKEDESKKKESSQSDKEGEASKGGCAMNASRNFGSLSALWVVLLGAGCWRRRRAVQ